MTTQPTESPDPTTKQPAKRRTDVERAAEMEAKAKEIRLIARQREARLKDKRIAKLESAISVIDGMEFTSVRDECRGSLVDLRNLLVDKAVPQ